MLPSPLSAPTQYQPPTASQRLWRGFCRIVVNGFYRRVEVAGTENVPSEGPLLLCANHANALVDALIVQAACPRPVHPLARSGLFRSALLRPILSFIQAVPVRRRRPNPATESDAEPSDSKTERNDDTFARCFTYLGEGRVILIFPEGQSHSDPRLRPIKTGAARMVLGSYLQNQEMPVAVPVGLTFTAKGRFRGDLLIQFGPEIAFPSTEPGDDTTDHAAQNDAPARALVSAYTEAIAEGLKGVTLDADSWDDVALVHRVEAFAAFREGRQSQGRPALRHRYRAFQRLIDTHRAMREAHPRRVAALRAKLQRFERLRERFGVRDYHLDLDYRPSVVARFVFRSLLFALTVFPLAAWGALNSILPYLSTRQMSRWSAHGRDQYDTASILFGLFFFGTFWGAQISAVAWWFGPKTAIYYGLSLPITWTIALVVGRERKRIAENLRAFFLFTRKRRVRAYLREKREELVADLARLAKLARQLPRKK